MDRGALRESVRDALQRELGKYRADFPGLGPGLGLRLWVEDGRPATALTEASRQAVLLAGGSHGRTALGPLILGSVSGEGLDHASCPVAVAVVPGAAERPV
ncbi:universal stress protein [Streptomyces goshikiensis]|uniref:universal stress protein n=1 Tax=Streptomyces goshikiensis TaxID=1942 RepID=UPI00371BA999